MLGFDNGDGQHGLVAAAMATASTGSSAVRPSQAESPHTSTTPQTPRSHPQPQASCFSTSPADCSPEESMVAPATPAPMAINLNATHVAGGSSTGGKRKRPYEIPVGNRTNGRNMFD